MTVMRRVLLLFFLVLITICHCEDLYEILGISRTADKATIKREYTKLARKWHPDKNRSPEAANTMMKINKAYEVLSNDARRRRYDLLGEESDKMPPSPSRGNSFKFGPFSFHTSPSSSEPTDQVNSKQFMETIIPDSDNKPYLIYYYHDFCSKCPQYAEKWEELRKDFHNLGLGTASVQVIVSTQATLYSKIYLNEVPKIALMINGKVHHYNGVLNLNEIKIFIDTIIPSIVEQIYTLPFLSNNSRILNNKPVVFLVSPRSNVSLNYKIITFTYQRYCDFFFISSLSASNELLSFLKLQQNDKQLFIYKELEEPAVTIKDSVFSTQLVKSTIIENKMLSLPRISFSLIFDSVCPHGVHIRTCLLLVVEGTSEYTDFKTNTFRQLATKWTTEDFGLAYIDAYRQISFLTKFYQSHDTTRKSCDDGSLAKSILILRRSTPRNARYRWYHSYCGTPEDEKVLKHFALSQEENLENSISLDPITDEDINLMNHFYDYFYHYWEKIMSFVFLPLPMLLISCYLFLFPKRGEPTNQQLDPENVHIPATNVEGSGQDVHSSINVEGSEQRLRSLTDVAGSEPDGHSSTKLEKSEQHVRDKDSPLNVVRSEQHERDENSSTNAVGSEDYTECKSSHSKHSGEKTDSDDRRSQSLTKQNSLASDSDTI